MGRALAQDIVPINGEHKAKEKDSDSRYTIDPGFVLGVKQAIEDEAERLTDLAGKRAETSGKPIDLDGFRTVQRQRLMLEALAGQFRLSVEQFKNTLGRSPDVQHIAAQFEELYDRDDDELLAMAAAAHKDPARK